MKSSRFIDTNWTDLSDRIESVLELLQKEHDIVGVISAQRDYQFYATIFYTLREPALREPSVAAKVIPIEDWSQCCICRPEDKADHYCAKHAPGGCVSVPETSVSEQLQEDLEPITNHGKRFCV